MITTSYAFQKIRRILFFVMAVYFFNYEQMVQAAETAFQKVIVYQDKPSRNQYAASGYMPSGECIEMDDAWQQGCQEGRSCVKATFKGNCTAWAGVYWLYPANNWGEQKGGHDLTGATKLVFWAKGDKGGEVIGTFKMGGVGMQFEYPDTDSATLENVTLTTEWQQFSIDLKGLNLSRISGGFAWVAKKADNPETINFYLDDIHYE